MLVNEDWGKRKLAVYNQQLLKTRGGEKLVSKGGL